MRRWGRSGKSVLDALSCPGDSSLVAAASSGFPCGRLTNGPTATDICRRPATPASRPLPEQQWHDYYHYCCSVWELWEGQSTCRLWKSGVRQYWASQKVPLPLSKALRLPADYRAAAYWPRGDTLSGLCGGLWARIRDSAALRKAVSLAVIWDEDESGEAVRCLGVARGFFGMQTAVF